MLTTNELIGRFRPSIYTLERATPHGIVFYTESPKPAAIAYRGKATKKAWYFTFRSVEQMTAHIDDFFKRLEKRAAELAERRKENAKYDAREHYKIGDVIYNSWGYDQTNVDFYVVVAVRKKFLTLRQCAQKTTETGFMCGHTIALPEKLTGEPERHGAHHSGYVTFKYGAGSKWDGRQMHCSWYA